MDSLEENASEESAWKILWIPNDLKPNMEDSKHHEAVR